MLRGTPVRGGKGAGHGIQRSRNLASWPAGCASYRNRTGARSGRSLLFGMSAAPRYAGNMVTVSPHNGVAMDHPRLRGESRVSAPDALMLDHAGAGGSAFKAAGAGRVSVERVWPEASRYARRAVRGRLRLPRHARREQRKTSGCQRSRPQSMTVHCGILKSRCATGGAGLAVVQIVRYCRGA